MQCEDLGSSNVFSRQNTTSAHNTETERKENQLGLRMVQVSALKLFIILMRRQVLHTLSQCPSFIFVSCFTEARGMIWAVTVLCHDKTFYHCLKLLCLNTDQ